MAVVWEPEQAGLDWKRGVQRDESGLVSGAWLSQIYRRGSFLRLRAFGAGVIERGPRVGWSALLLGLSARPGGLSWLARSGGGGRVRGL